MHLGELIPIILLALIVGGLLVGLIPFADRDKLLKAFIDKQQLELEDVRFGEQKLWAKLMGHKMQLAINENVHINSGSGGTSRRIVHEIEVSLTLPGCPKGLSLSRDTLGYTLLDPDGQSELTFDDPDFDNAFWVSAGNEAKARDFLSPEMRTWLAQFFGRRKVSLEDGVLKLVKSCHVRFGVGTLVGVVQPFTDFLRALNGASRPKLRPGYILKAQLRTWAVPTALLGWMAWACGSLSPIHENLNEAVLGLSLLFGLWFLVPLPGAKTVFKVWWPTVGLIAFGNFLTAVWHWPIEWYQKLGSSAAGLLLGLLVWAGWKDMRRRK